MIYRFDEFELDFENFELRCFGDPVHLEPQVFALLCLLVENHDRMVTKEEIIEKIWDGRFISDAAVSSRIRGVRKALGDKASEQKYVRTHYKKGLKFLVTPKLSSRLIAAEERELRDLSTSVPTRSLTSIAVLPFVPLGELGPLGPVSDAIPHDLIVALSGLRWLSVVARGSSFRFRGDNQDVVEIGRILGVAYCLSGSVEAVGAQFNINIELSRTVDGQLVWAEHFLLASDHVLELRDEIVKRCLVELELQISKNEAHVTDTRGSTTLDAWSSFHIGLQQYYRFNKSDNQQALAYFERACEHDQANSRAFAARSSAHFQIAFYRYGGDHLSDIEQCRKAAARAIELDPLDPFANYAQGRVLWLTHEIGESAKWFAQAIELSPSYSHGHYASSWTDIVLSRTANALERAEAAMKLSPLDPFLASMQWIKACALLQMEQADEAIQWSEKAARSPRATIVMPLLAAVTNQVGGQHVDAKYWADQLRGRNPRFQKDDMFKMMPFQDSELRKLFEETLGSLGF